jgi:predicted ATP-grasp superfamily ATP-dependent carboligase
VIRPVETDPTLLASRRRVLVIDGDDGQSRSALAAVWALAASGYRPVVGTAAKYSLAASSRASTNSVHVPLATDDRFGEAVRAEVQRGEYLCALPSSDPAMLALDAPGVELLDKDVLARRADAAGIPTVGGFLFGSYDDLVAARREFDYPVVVKPSVKSAAADGEAVRVDSPAELERLASRNGRAFVQPWIDAPMHAVAGVVWRGRLVAAVHQEYLRTWPVVCGTASAAVTIRVTDDVVGPIVRMLDGYDGVFQAQFVGRFLVDLNPRVYGSLPLAVAAGANLPAVVCDLMAGRDVPTTRARPGVAYRWPEGDLKHLVARAQARSLPARSLLAALRPRRPTAHSVMSLRDPRPMLTRIGYVARRSRSA